MKFVYLGATVTRKGGLEEDVRSRLRKGETAFSKLRNIHGRGTVS